MNKNHILEALFIVSLFSIILIKGNDFIIIMFTSGVILGVITAFKFNRDKVGGLVVFALAIFITALISGLMFGQRLHHINTDLLTPFQLSIYQKLSVIWTICYGFILGSSTIVALKLYIKNRKNKQNGYLVCDGCGNYYKLKEGKSADDLEDTCECGGYLVHKDDI